MPRKANPTPPAPALLTIRRNGIKIWSPIRNNWYTETPEERVRQEYVCVLVNEYGYGLDQMDEERHVAIGNKGNARADIVVWRSARDKVDQRAPLIVVECKSDAVTIRERDYRQGDSYARTVNAPFVVTHNSKQTKYWRVEKDRMPGWLSEIENIPRADATDRQIAEQIARLKTFKEDEFATLLHKCHNIIRNAEQRDPADAFDEIAKVLFVKVFVERELRAKRKARNLFDVEYLDDQLGKNPLDLLFQQTKEEFRTDRIFAADDKIRLRPDTGREVVKELQRYNLSDTSEDIKGIAFERFLGRTFRGEIGQFFTPRTIVEFMIRMVDPQEGEVVCDPASGSGGFLIRVFEIVREAIHRRADTEYQAVAASVASLAESKRALRLIEADRARQAAIDQATEGSAVWRLANRCIYGCDANERMARTSKMNMIMHGDGHGGVHHHNGFLNVNGIFDGRFDVVLTNPPFGAHVPRTAVVEVAATTVPNDVRERYREMYGERYDDAQARVKAARGKPIASLFKLPFKGGSQGADDDLGKVKTELLFIERCLDLLKPGGRLGIVLPEGIFNNPSLVYVRTFVEDRAFLRAVVSLPQDTFMSSGASVKASLLFLQKYTAEEAERFEATRTAAQAEIDGKYHNEIVTGTAAWQAKIAAAKLSGKDERAKQARKDAEAGLASFLREMAERKASESRALLKRRLDYPIFLYEAEHVGITATGEADQNELYPNPNLPPGVERTALERYQEFVAHRGDPDFFG